MNKKTIIIVSVIILLIGIGIGIYYFYFYNAEEEIIGPKFPGRCGPEFDNQKCGLGQCCSKAGWCGGKNLKEGEHCTFAKRNDNLYDGP